MLKITLKNRNLFGLLKLNKTINVENLLKLKMNIFTQKLNPITGKCDWEVQDENYDYHQEVARSAFADMLHDTERNQKYEAALRIAINDMHNKGKKANVLDIGTGTGLLSMMAVRNGADSVIACEAFKPMCQCAAKVIKGNSYEDKIKLLHKRSTDLTVGENCDMKERANILVTEVFDTELIGEGALNTFKHAHESLLEKDAIVIPHTATIYVQIVESSLVNKWNRLKDVYDDDGKLLVSVPKSIINCRGAASVHDIQLNQIDLNDIKFLIEPYPVFRFDWSGKTPFIFERTTINTLRAQNSGKAQAVFMWWDLLMDIENKIVLSCAPFWAHNDSKQNLSKNIPWRDHWMQAVYYLPKELVLDKNEEIHLISCHDEYSIWFNLKKDLKLDDESYINPFCDCGLHISYSRTRIGQLNDLQNQKKYLKSLKKYIKKDSVVLILSHGFYLALASCKFGAKHVYFYESNHLSNNLIQNFIAFNDFKNVTLIKDEINVNELPSKINLVFGEPYFVTSVLPWDSLFYLYLLKTFSQKFSENVEIIPKRVIIKTVAVEFENLHKIRAPLKVCEGFIMQDFDQLIKVIH